MIALGAATEPEMQKKEARVEDALHARGLLSKKNCSGEALPCSELPMPLKSRPKLGRRRIDRSRHRTPCNRVTFPSFATTPCRRFLGCQQVLKSKGSMGYSVATDKHEDLIKAGVVDPTKVTRTALQNAGSVAVFF